MLKMDWAKGGGLLPAVVQDAGSGKVLMLGYMDEEALARSLETGRVTFFSRSKNRLWTKGEASGNYLALESVHADCDADTLLVLARPAGPTCHRGTETCFAPEAAPGLSFLAELEALIAERLADPPPGSYTASLAQAGIKRVAQKVGEEGLECALAAATGDAQELSNEAADLVYHLLVLLRLKGLDLAAVLGVLAERHRLRAQA
ncbi:MAG: bifunctional phosphoribosyl-AMP cyclohydrolase/phosphoribosyl-ATP diphosphatase HisIE [Gammaproteobacteria bacterium]|nr:bifunctional phosphoribosyl-AMP cyclohydrolase/phosphoribosyl-ATP diphosphatase HisIE [Gammaproteobacteria bacterium]